MGDTHLDDKDGNALPVLEQVDKYVAFPGNPEKVVGSSILHFLVAFIGYTSWVIVGEIREGGNAGTPPLKTAESIVTHLSAFSVLLTIIIIIFCKGLERVMYYLDAKRIADQLRQRAEQAEQRAEQAERLLEETKKNKP